MSINFPTVTGATATGLGLLLVSGRVDKFAIGTLVTGIGLIILGQYADSKDTAAPLANKNIEKLEDKSACLKINLKEAAGILGKVLSVVFIIGASAACGAMYMGFQSRMR